MSTYYTYEPIQQPILPKWSTTWLGSDGCPNRSVYYTNTWTAAPPAPGLPKTYTPVDSRGWKEFGVSGRTRSVPPYVFTKYSVGRVTTKQYLIKIKKGVRGLCRWYQYGTVPKVGGACTLTIGFVTNSGPAYTTYYESTRDFPNYDTYTRTDIREGDVSLALNEVQNEMVTEAATAYDALTDIAELREVPRMITSIAKDLYKVYRSLRSRFGRDVMRSAYSLNPLELLKHPDRAFRKLGDQWMAYRYGIMPLVYSYRDALRMLHRGQQVKTHKSRTITPYDSGATLPPSNTRYWVCDVVGSVVVRGTVFQHFESDEIARISSLGVNPLVTAWELIPYSFVADWFVNVGDYLAASTCQYMSQKKWACLSRRNKFTRKRFLHLGNEDQTIVIDSAFPVNWQGAYPPNLPNEIIRNPAGDFIFEEEEVDSYDRWPCPIQAAPLRVNPSLNWRRMIDGAVMSNNLLGRFTRSFR